MSRFFNCFFIAAEGTKEHHIEKRQEKGCLWRYSPSNKHLSIGNDERCHSPEIYCQFGFLRDIENKYTKTSKVLGYGAFGTVFLGEIKGTGELVAIKTIRKAALRNEMHQKSLRQEVDVLNHVGNGSLNCISLLDTYEDETFVYLVMEYAAGGTLKDRFQRQSYFTEAEVVCVIRSVLQTIAQCHAKNIIYRDVKLENFVYMHSGKDSLMKAIDFGLAVYHAPRSSNLTQICGSPNYIAPEVINQAYSFPCDLWSAGVMTYVLLAGRQPFTGNLELSGRDRIISLMTEIKHHPIQLEGPKFANLSEKGKDFMHNLLQKDPDKRMTAQEALLHPWLTEHPSIHHCLSGKHSIIARVQRFSTYNRIKKATLTHILRDLWKNKSRESETSIPDNINPLVQSKRQSKSEDLLHKYMEDNPDSIELATFFQQLDKEQRGSISERDAKEGFINAGYQLSMTEFQKIWSSLSNENGETDLRDFMVALTDWQQLDGVLSEGGGCISDLLKQVFNQFDHQGKGYLLKADIARVLNKLETSPEVMNVVDILDRHRIGRIYFEDFELAMTAGNKVDALHIYDSRHDCNSCVETADITLAHANLHARLSSVGLDS